MWAVVPVKDLRGAKQRLAEVLSVEERGALFQAMLEDVLSALQTVRGLEGFVLITCDQEAKRLAADYGARVMSEPENRGHTAAVATAVTVLQDDGADGMLQLPGDVPLVTADEIEAVIEAHEPGPAMTIVPSRDRKGSNCVACSPPQVMPLRFGDDSFYPHLETAKAHGLTPNVISLPGIAHDVDTPDDLLALLGKPAKTRAHRFLNDSGLAERLQQKVAPPGRRVEG